MKNIHPGVWAGSCIALFASAFLFEARTYPYSGPLGMGPGFFPVWLYGILLMLSLCYIFTSLRDKDASPVSLPQGAALRNIAFIIINLVVFVVGVKFLGFTISSTMFLFALLSRGYARHTSFAIAAGASVFLYWLFYQLMGVQLPLNSFGW